ncbi:MULTISPECIES: DUF1643 domain-containing protein [Paenibacillus]|uniref:DUF1643 domain-containing protein n=1 Tax=Paenibacillus TaxID=44249 RepID=UPI00096CB719|nr:DUF1643 domain-containing protein [Paenibacillus odorifer]OME13958.1 hypothetical protein BSK60_13975 [Paenibacillus odorifer]
MIPKISESTITSRAIFSDNGEYRYRLSRTWDEEKKKGVLLMLNPSKATELLTDRTVMNVTNFLINAGYGGIEVINLFSYMTPDTKNLRNRDLNYERYNDSYILDVVSCVENPIVIIGWGSDSSKYITRKRQVEKLITLYADKLKCFQDKNKRKPRHPRDYTGEWTLVDYDLVF